MLPILSGSMSYFAIPVMEKETGVIVLSYLLFYLFLRLTRMSCNEPGRIQLTHRDGRDIQ